MLMCYNIIFYHLFSYAATDKEEMALHLLISIEGNGVAIAVRRP